MRIQELTLIGFGAIGRSVHQRMLGHAGVRITHIVVSPAKVAALQAELGPGVTVTHQVPASTPLVLECAGHTALTAHVLPALRRGTECAVLSIGALSEPGLPERLHSGLVVTPGTHSKWIRFEDDRISDFRTFMTGELFARADVLLAPSAVGEAPRPVHSA